MNVEERQTCQDCGKDILNQKGSITQWIGLGDHCRCAANNQEKTDGKSRNKRSRVCKKCLRPITSNQSLTQWLIRKETCRCNQSVDYAPVTDYTSKALSNTSHRVLRKSDSKPVVVAISLGVLAVSALCVTKVFEGSDFTGLIGIFDQLKTPAGRLRGRQRIISVKRSNSSLDSYSKNNPVDSLRTVDIMHSSISDEELNNLRQYYGICKISLINCDGFTARGIRSLSQVESLEILDLDCSEVGDFGSSGR